MKILSIQSAVAYGHVGNSAAVFPMQRIGVDVLPVYTVNFSNHTGYGAWRGPLISPDDVREVITGIEEREVFPQIDAILSGYQGGEGIADVIIDAVARVKAATEQDWSTEYLDAIISVKEVAGIDAAMAHIRTYGSQHTDAIIAQDQATADRFLSKLDSAIVLHNASTQFADGGEFGMGAEIGIATGRMHARGPVGVEQLTTFKYVVRGTGQTRPG